MLCVCDVYLCLLSALMTTNTSIGDEFTVRNVVCDVTASCAVKCFFSILGNEARLHFLHNVDCDVLCREERISLAFDFLELLTFKRFYW